MKRLRRLAVGFVALVAVPLFAFNDNKGLVGEVIRMSQAGVNDDAIVEYIVHTAGRFDVTSNDVIAMTRAGVSRRVVRVMIDEAASRDAPPAEPEYASASIRDHDPTPPWTAFYDPWWFLPKYYKTR